MADLATLKSRIASELHRSDLTTSIASAIADAVLHYQSTPFRFNEAIATFSTVAGTEFYADLSDVGQIDEVRVLVNGRKTVLEPWSYGYMEAISTTTNTESQPWAWAWYAEQLRLYPVPDAAYTVTVSYTKQYDVPAADGDSNVWTTQAEALIRHAAKKRIYRDVTRDLEAATTAEAAEAEALRNLTQDTNRLASGPLRGSM